MATPDDVMFHSVWEDHPSATTASLPPLPPPPAEYPQTPTIPLEKDMIILRKTTEILDLGPLTIDPILPDYNVLHLLNSTPILATPKPPVLDKRLSESASREIFFSIELSEPVKVGDVVSSHTVYKVSTFTNSPAYLNPRVIVQRRYRDFLWLFNTFVAKYPGVIVPPIPEKHAIGRFLDDFIESRRIALEKCLRKLVLHPILQNDSDIRIFLESQTFTEDISHRKKDEKSSAGPGFLQSMLGLNNASSTNIGPSQSSESLSSIANHSADATNYAAYPALDTTLFEQKKLQIDQLEVHLKALAKALDILVKQKKDLGQASGDFAECFYNLSQIELASNITSKFGALADIQRKVQDIQSTQSKVDLVYLSSCADEWCRTIGSIRIAMNARTKACDVWTQAEVNLLKKRESLEKLRAAKQTRSDKISIILGEIEESERHALIQRKEYDDICEVLAGELDRCEEERVIDFVRAADGFVKAYIASQTEIIAKWEEFPRS